MKEKEKKKEEWDIKIKEFQEAMQELSMELMKNLIPAIEEATENIKNLNLEDSLELIQDEEIEDGK